MLEELWQPGNTTPSFKAMPKLGRYWEQVLDDIDSIFHIKLLRFPAYVLLGLSDRLSLPLSSLRGKATMLVLRAACQTLTAMWGKPNPPTHMDLLHRFVDFHGHGTHCGLS